MDLFETLGLGPRQPEENELYVAIYADPPDPRGDPFGEDAEAEAAGGDEADRLERLRARCTAWMLTYTAGYVWHKDPLVLRSSAAQPPPWERRGPGGRRGRGAAPATSSSPPASASDAPGQQGAQGAAGAAPQPQPEGCVWAAMRFGDAVDDEWWGVWLLLRMSRELQDLTVQVWDNDGQFLLIEAAYALPRWLKPETAEGRVWLRRGQLHVLPLPSAAAPDLPAAPSRAQALAVLREGRYPTASPRVQRPIDERLAGYPARARAQQQHAARCLLPAALAAALRAEPQLVAELVEAFYYRDADDMRRASRMRCLPPSLERRPALVRMGRCHYAQLAQQRFAAPRGMPMPPPDSPLAKAADLGLKLTVGAEVILTRLGGLAQHAKQAPASEQAQQAPQAPGAEQAGPSHAPPEGASTEAAATAEEAAAAQAAARARALAADPSWRRFLGSLEGNGYFQGNIPGSRRYKELLAAAQEAFAAGRTAAGEAAAGTGGGGAVADPRRRLLELVRHCFRSVRVLS
ncbi:hypothetical protein HYH03_006550 [Edaphochlamys debaryana]|uniref:Uncharacterized protein n=1 Tax=Edaphochlamys debaryana TaxID=47281 RepID=A0A835Y522_9CHLO|nr:hypothetical protein HYH03_006550 [Edaphochlamys debaryana]|eukprot:KAG2495277.1 hypothetical protein HYH03_006550 [Edaphochlamys debaryana]